MWSNWQLWNGENLHSTALSKITKIYVSPVMHLSFPNSLLHGIPGSPFPLLFPPTLPRLPGSSLFSAICYQVLQIHLTSVIRTMQLFPPKSLTFLSETLFFFCFVSSAHENHKVEKWRHSGPSLPTYPTTGITTHITTKMAATSRDTRSWLSGPDQFI